MRWDVTLTRGSCFPRKGFDVCVKWCKGGWEWAKVHLLQGNVFSRSESLYFELCESLLPLDPKGLRADVTLDSWHSRRPPTPTLCWLSEWQVWQEAGNELRAKKVRPIKLGLNITVVGTRFLCSGWQVFVHGSLQRCTFVAGRMLLF